MAVCDDGLRDDLESALAIASAAVTTSLVALREAGKALAAASLAVAQAETFEATA